MLAAILVTNTGRASLTMHTYSYESIWGSDSITPEVYVWTFWLHEQTDFPFGLTLMYIMLSVFVAYNREIFDSACHLPRSLPKQVFPTLAKPSGQAQGLPHILTTIKLCQAALQKD